MKKVIITALLTDLLLTISFIALFIISGHGYLTIYSVIILLLLLIPSFVAVYAYHSLLTKIKTKTPFLTYATQILLALIIILGLFTWSTIEAFLFKNNLQSIFKYFQHYFTPYILLGLFGAIIIPFIYGFIDAKIKT